MSTDGRHGVRWQLVATISVVLVVTGALLIKVSTGIGQTRSIETPASVAVWELDTAYFSCLATQVKSLVPPGQLVWVSTLTPKNWWNANDPSWSAPLRKV